MINAGIFGPKLSGKTTLAKALSRQYFIQQHLKTIVLDINEDEWGGHAVSTSDEQKFWKLVWESKKCLIIVDEAAATIRRERTLIPVFTRLRHNNHLLITIGHSGMDLLPIMRQQLDTLFLFRQPISSAKVWAEVFTENGLLESVNLSQFEFIRHELYGHPKRQKLAKI